MLHMPRWQVYLIVGICLIGMFLALPNVLPESVRKSMPGWIPAHPVPLGLDLRGGAYLLLEANIEAAVKERTESVRDDVRKAIRTARIQYEQLRISQSNDTILFRIMEPEKV